jgi:pyruvate dehydrogenase E1 component alpha subunit
MLAPAPLPEDPTTLLPDAVPVQVLDPEGVRHDRPGLDVTDDPAELILLYRSLRRARRIDAQALTLSRQGRIGAFPTALGQEAVEVGAVLALERNDWLFPTYRDTMAVVTRGVDPIEVLRGNQASTFYDYDVHAHRVASMAIPLATQAVHAAGLALAAKLRDDPLAVLTFIGDGATSEGDTHEAMNFAAVFGAPAVFLVVNNQWAISTPVSRQSHGPSLAHRGIGYGMPGTRVDGNDVLAVHATVRDALARARRGGGPSLVEAVTYRIEAHTASDDPSRYRSDDEVEQWRARDPIARLERHLRAEHGLDDAAVAAIEHEVEQDAQRIREWAAEAPELDPTSMFAHVYADPPPALGEQRQQLIAELTGKQEQPA